MQVFTSMLKPFPMQGLHLFRGGLVCAQNVLDAIDGCLNPDYVINKEVLKRG